MKKSLNFLCAVGASTLLLASCSSKDGDKIEGALDGGSSRTTDTYRGTNGTTQPSSTGTNGTGMNGSGTSENGTSSNSNGQNNTGSGTTTQNGTNGSGSSPARP